MLKDYLTDDGVIVTLQNGIPEPGIAEIIGTEHTMGCAVEWGAALIEPGVCELTSEPDSLSFHMGKMNGITDEQFNEVKALLELMCPVHEEPNLMGARWSKLLINATFSGLGTVVGGVFGDVSEDKIGKQVAIRCMKECIDVGHAAGVTFAPVQGKNITGLFYYKGALKRTFGTLLLPVAMKKHLSRGAFFCIYHINSLKNLRLLFSAFNSPACIFLIISTIRSLIGVFTPYFLPNSHTTPLIASTSQGLPFFKS